MEANLTQLLELAVQQGIWAVLYIYLFFRMLRENKEREERYQTMIDRLSGNLLEMSMKASTPRFWVKKGCGVNAQEFLDWSKPLVEVEGSIDEERLRQISLYNLEYAAAQDQRAQGDEQQPRCDAGQRVRRRDGGERHRRAAGGRKQIQPRHAARELPRV